MKAYAKALLVILGLASMAAVGVTNMGPEYRRQTITVPSFYTIVPAVGTSSVAGREGVVMHTTLRASTTVMYYHFTWTSSLAALPYPSRLQFKLVDDTTSTQTFRCSSAKVVGVNSLGDEVTENLGDYYGSYPITETSTHTKWAYQRVDRIDINGCQSSSAINTLYSSDVIQVRTTRYVGLPVRFRKPSSLTFATSGDTRNRHPLLSFCWRTVDVNGSAQCTRVRDLRNYTLDENYATIDVMGQAMGGFQTVNSFSPTGHAHMTLSLMGASY